MKTISALLYWLIYIWTIHYTLQLNSDSRYYFICMTFMHLLIWTYLNKCILQNNYRTLHSNWWRINIAAGVLSFLFRFSSFLILNYICCGVILILPKQGLVKEEEGDLIQELSNEPHFTTLIQHWCSVSAPTVLWLPVVCMWIYVDSD